MKFRTLGAAIATATMIGITPQIGWTDSVSDSADVDILATISITSTRALDFGSLAPPEAGAGTGTVECTADAAATTVTSTNMTQFDPCISGQLDVTGVTGAGYDITLPTSVTLSGSTMTITLWEGSAGGSGTLTGGADTFYIGATLNVPAGQTAGTFSGAYTITVNYQ